MKQTTIAALLIFLFIQAYPQKGEYIITHSGDTIYGEIKSKSIYETEFYRVVSIDDDGKKEKHTVYPSDILKMKMGYRTYLSKNVDNEKETSLFDTRDRKYLTNKFYLWEVESEQVNTMKDGMITPGTANYNGLNGSVLIASTTKSYYLENKDGEAFLTLIPQGKRKLSKFLKEQECNNVAKGVETGYLDHKDIRKVLEEYINRCLD